MDSDGRTSLPHGTASRYDEIRRLVRRSPLARVLCVEHDRWLAPGEMLDGLGMAETTPGRGSPCTCCSRARVRVVPFVGGGIEVPDPASVRRAALALTAAAIVAVFRFRVGVLGVLAGCALAGVAIQWAGLV